MRLKEIMSSPAETVGPDTSVADSRARMTRARIHHLVVGAGRNIEGIISARDLDGAAPDTRVDEIMSRPVITAAASMSVADAAKILRGHSIGCLPVVERGKLVGMVTISDLLAQLGKGAIHIQPSTGRFVLARRGPARGTRQAMTPR